MDEPLQAHTLNEVKYYLMVTPCPACGKGPWISDATKPAEAIPADAIVDAHCKQCRHRQAFAVACEYSPPETGAGAEVINPDDEPSRIIDLGQWLSLFYMLIESAASQQDPVETRRLGFRAALCLAEALKFYGDDELPPESAFFSPERLETYRKSPENFARQKLRDMQGKLPHLDVMARNVSRDERTQTARRKWWQFWRRGQPGA
jgi:hypothetical protein